MTIIKTTSKRTRHERKLAQRQILEQRKQYEREHPVLSGVVPVVAYVPPRWDYYVPV